MTPVAHARLTTAVTVTVAGLAGGHLLNPHAPAASPARGVAFYGLMALLGAWRGWSEARARDHAPADAAAARRAYRVRLAFAAAYAAGALLLSALAYRVVHGG